MANSASARQFLLGFLLVAMACWQWGTVECRISLLEAFTNPVSVKDPAGSYSFSESLPHAALADAAPSILRDENFISEIPDSDIRDSNVKPSNDGSGGAHTLASYAGCGTGNPVDDCWRCDPHWASHRQALADCAIGFGRRAIGGQNGRIYVVTSEADDDVANPVPGTLRYAATRTEPLWIIFARDMKIYLKNELIMTSFKTIDGRGTNVHITGGAGLTLQYVSNIIIHGIHVHDIVATGPARVISSETHVGQRGRADGDAISLFTAKDVWIDHNYLAKANDGLIDAIRGSTSITISNNYFTDHDKVMLFGAHPTDTIDRGMQVTVAFNIFGPGLVQRMPRCRFGSFHVVNNDYTAGWGIYAIGGSEAPTILSEGNQFSAPNSHNSKEVTKRIHDGGSNYGGYQSWNWKSAGDIFLNGAYFTNTGAASQASPLYSKAYSFSARPGQLVSSITKDSGPLVCAPGSQC